jgi:16S rRNA (guanine1207-N2)-methyltransferase
MFAPMGLAPTLRIHNPRHIRDIINKTTINPEGHMTLQSHLLNETIHLTPRQHVLFLNSAADPFVSTAAQHITTGTITLAEDNITSLHQAQQQNPSSNNLRHIPFHEYTLKEPPATMDIAILNLLYQPAKTWIIYGLHVAAYALKPGGQLYVVGAKDRGILSTAKQMEEYFGNIETLLISKGHRVVSSRKISGDSTNKNNSAENQRYFSQISEDAQRSSDVEDTSNNSANKNNSAENQRYFSQISEDAAKSPATSPLLDALHDPSVFAHGKLDEGTRLLLDALEIQPTDEALDIGCGAGYLGLYIARHAHKGHVIMVDASLATVALAQRNIQESGLSNIEVLPSDGAQSVLSHRFDLVVTNPPFHQGGIQTTTIAERFIREAAQILRPTGRFYLVANRFLKYEPTLRTHFKKLDEVAGNTRFKILRALKQ